MRYLLPLLFLLGACQDPQVQPATDGSTQTVAILASNVDSSPCAMQADCEACASKGSMKSDAGCDKEGSACCGQPVCKEE
ncbi:MAG: hypothetical protein CMJ93_05295 [Planctomycetes bacterium]|nr:hypothetical protein [Planctomycetota bacterium]|tara:strand:- start:461 stop:700 length:240 start_codon:yes stop_codon:yes gene_type:complete